MGSGSANPAAVAIAAHWTDQPRSASALGAGVHDHIGGRVGRHRRVRRQARRGSPKLLTTRYLSPAHTEISALGQDRPQIMPELDRVLLQDAAAVGMYDLPFELRKELRDAFWDVFDRLCRTGTVAG